jgi:nitroimidazol reductase NimA-like FMN-containing flavoprotein (pyridoxamine 5'-phosphate oxidase superfamily)
MDKRELASELSQHGARELLETGALMRLAYNGHDGAPRVIPIAFLWNGTDVGATPADTRSLLIRGPAKVKIVAGVPREHIVQKM